MRTELCDRFGIEYPIFVFTPSEKVAAAVTRAGGLGVLGCVRFNAAEDLEDVREALGVPDDVPMITTDARDRAQTKMALLELVQHALIRASAAAG